MTMTPAAKRQLSTTIRELRTRLLVDLHDATEGAYRFQLRPQEAGLSMAARVGRRRLEEWIAEQLRAQAGGKGKKQRTAEDFRVQAEKQAAYTLLNRLVILRLLESSGLREPAVLIGGFNSRAYHDFRELCPAMLRGDDTEGYAFLLRLCFEDLAHVLPGLFGPAGVADLVPIPAKTLRHIVEALDEKELESVWQDDMTLGWVYQYWNDPEREALDDKLNAGGKVEPHEIASKTQMFTERYMVDWLLQNSLGPLWLAMCKKHGWSADVAVDGTLQRLEDRRIAWRRQREAGEVSLTELMPLHTDAERRWAYYVPQPIPEDAVQQAPDSVRNLKLLDPAVGSGHFLVVAFELLVALYREEARHRGEAGDVQWADHAIVERILEHNLHGIDLDPRAVQIAAAALWMKAQKCCDSAKPRTLNLVASDLRLASLPDTDPALLELRREVELETGIPGPLTDTLVHALRGADHLGSLLQVDTAVEVALRQQEEAVKAQHAPQQLSLLGAPEAVQAQIPFVAAAAKKSLVEKLETFLSHHTTGDDLGLRLRGEQLASGVRFVRMIRRETYDLVVGNPPYQGTAKIADATYVQTHYEKGKADLYAAFLERGLQLVRKGGISALLTMRNWMFIKQYADLREWLLETYDLRALGDFDRGAFEEVPDEVVSVVVSIFRRAPPNDVQSIALQPTPIDDRSRDSDRTLRKRAATTCHVGRYEFVPSELKVVPEWPVVYSWNAAQLREYQSVPKLGKIAIIRQGIATANDTRFLRDIWEVRLHIPLRPHPTTEYREQNGWSPYITGGNSISWIQEAALVINWKLFGAELAHFSRSRYGRGAGEYFMPGIAFSMIGNTFDVRAHRFPSIFGAKGSSIFSDSIENTLCLLNSRKARAVVESLNPSVSFTSGDVARVPLFEIAGAMSIYAELRTAFSVRESHREPSVEFRMPGPSPWRHAQAWAQAAVDRAEGAPLPPYEAVYDAEPATDHVSFALGVVLGRFGASGEGIRNPETDNLEQALPDGICLLDGTLDENDRRDSLGQPAAAPLDAAWAAYGETIDPKLDLRSYLRTKFFPDVHRPMYEGRPIHWPLSSEGKTFVAWVNIHRFNEKTLRVLLADHLHPALTRLDGELADLRAARDGADKKAARAAEKRFDKVQRGREELIALIAQVEACADRGPPPVDGKCPPREIDARYAPDLDDGVLVNSAALWPLLDPQWKEPKKWWRELATAQGKKDYDWSHLAMRYFPQRVDKKCQKDPSLGVAHGCFWRYHSARAWAWELRLQDEIAPDFRITERPYCPGGRDVGDGGDAVHRSLFLADEPEQALAAVEKEALRRIGRGLSRAPVPTMSILESGLWSARPNLVWELELRVAKVQRQDFRLLAPDEPAARAALVATHPKLVAHRKKLLDDLAQLAALFGNVDSTADEDESDVDVGADESDSEEDVA